MKLISKNLIWFFIIVSFIGFADATYLTVNHYLGVTLPCSLLHGCDTVARSAYAAWWGIPVALVGAFYYLTILITALLYLDLKKPKFLLILTYLPITAFLFSIYFTYLQGVVIKAWCQYCLLSALTSTVLFVAGLVLGRRLKLTT